MNPESTRLVYENRWIRLYEDTFSREDGSGGIYSYVHKVPFAIILPWDGGRLHLVRQYRYPIGSRRWELPQGALEDSPDADPLAIASTELAEETGLQAGKLRLLGTVYPMYGLSVQAMHVVEATALTPLAEKVQGDEVDIETAPFGLAQIREMILEGELIDGCTLAALQLWSLHGGPAL